MPLGLAIGFLRMYACASPAVLVPATPCVYVYIHWGVGYMGKRWGLIIISVFVVVNIFVDDPRS